MHRPMTAQACMETYKERSSLLFLVLLLSGDIAFAVLHCLNILLPGFKKPLLSIETDQGYAEIYQYLKWLWIILVLIFVSFKEASMQYLAWVLLFAYFLLDDSLRVHERAGEMIAVEYTFKQPFGLHRQDLGELAVSAMIGSILIIPLSWAYIGGSKRFRKVSHDLSVLISVLIFFGVVVDMAHSTIDLGTAVGLSIGLIEDGGEMVSVSLILWYVFLMLIREKETDCYLYDCLHTLLKMHAARFFSRQ